MCPALPVPGSHPRRPQTKSVCEQHQKEIVTFKDKIISLEKENTAVKCELRVVKQSTNRSELASRFLTVRILGMPVSAEERAAASPKDRKKQQARMPMTRFSNLRWSLR
jgi:hypothetical protein